MSKKIGLIRTVAVIAALTLVVLTVLPGCNFVGKADPDAVNNTSNRVNDTGLNNQVCCPACSSTDVTGPDADGYYVCNACKTKWLYEEDKIDVVDKDGNVIGTYDPSDGYVSGGSNSSGNHGGGSNSGTTRPNGSTPDANNPSKPNGNSNDSKYQLQQIIKQLQEDAKNFSESVEFVYNEETGEITVKSTNGADTGLFGFKYSTKDKIFFTAEDAWQRNFGFSEIYDDTSGFGAISYDTIRVYFAYDNREWMVQFWKGQYGFVFIGSEIGIYNRPVGSSPNTYYECVTDDDKLLMSMDVYRRESSTSNKFNHLFTRSPSKTWWCTGFVPGTLRAGGYVARAEDTKQLRVNANITLKDAEMAQAFIGGLKNVKVIEHNAPAENRTFSFKEVAYSDFNTSSVNGRFALAEDGKTVKVSWR